MNKILAIVVLSVSVSACATASKPGAMVPELTSTNLISESSVLSNAVIVGDVSGGKKTNPLWTSQVSSEDFAETLRQTLAAHAMLATDQGTFRLDAELQELKQPFGGFDMSVTSLVSYKVTNIESGEVVYNDVVQKKYTAKMGDALMGVERLRLANEGSVKGNISEFMESFIAEFDTKTDAPEAGEVIS